MDRGILTGPVKSNFIEAIELLRATPTDFAAAIRDGCGGEGIAVERRNHRQDREKLKSRLTGSPVQRTKEAPSRAVIPGRSDVASQIH
ncbi:MAG: hypothetical protein F4186_08880 [Boseongicola sp. SB0676_bin_33]|nr:hypothetical protein [Boseongicola sp. SB0676_bin_33]